MHNHVISGDLNILDDNELIEIFKYGSKFRLIPRLNKAKIKQDIRNDVEDYIYKLSFKLNIHLGNFSEWKAKLLKAILDRIDTTNNTFPCTTNLNIFSDKIKNLQNKYVIMPVDKLVIILVLFVKSFMQWYLYLK